MYKIINEEVQKVPIKAWTNIDSIEPSAKQQLKNVASLPFIFKHVAVMPDVHYGKGATVGSVIATKGAVLPAAVGVDIGCGMLAIKIDENPNIFTDNAKIIRNEIERIIPVGFYSNKDITKSVSEWNGWAEWENLCKMDINKNSLKKKTISQLGSLGGGNHFIELCTDTNGSVWIMLHSGSRNLGKSLAEVHIDNAKSLMKKMFIDLPDPDLAYFVTGTKDYENYMQDIGFAQNYAMQNRLEMLKRILNSLKNILGFEEELKTSHFINCHHNYAEIENHFGENVLVTRKGAIRARKNDYGIIPGSMGTRSYIVKGLGNVDSFCSCSHGAGRAMSRGQAKIKFSIMDLIEQTNGVECRKDLDVLDEIPAAYKNIDEVMENQKDLVEVVAELKQFICIKG